MCTRNVMLSCPHNTIKESVYLNHYFDLFKFVTPSVSNYTSFYDINKPLMLFFLLYP